jgi:hypothetical protein
MRVPRDAQRTDAFEMKALVTEAVKGSRGRNPRFLEPPRKFTKVWNP